MLKNMIYAGFGAASMMKESMEKEMKNMDCKHGISKDDMKDFFSELGERGKHEDEKAKEKMKDHLKEIIDELGLVTKDDMENIKKEILKELKRDKK